jgi:hypothetical protein
LERLSKEPVENASWRRPESTGSVLHLDWILFHQVMLLANEIATGWRGARLHPEYTESHR